MKKMLLLLMGVLGALCVAGEPVIILDQPLPENTIFDQRTPLFIPAQQPIVSGNQVTAWCHDKKKREAWAYDVCTFQCSRCSDEVRAHKCVVCCIDKRHVYQPAHEYLYGMPVTLAAVSLMLSMPSQGILPLGVAIGMPIGYCCGAWCCSCACSKCPCDYTDEDNQRVVKTQQDHNSMVANNQNSCS